MRAKAYLLAEWPALAWQEAANAAAETAPKKAAVAARLSGRMKRPWLRRVNRPWVAAPLMTLTGHEGTVVDVAASNDGRRILSLGIDGSLRVWDAESGAPILIKRDAVVPGKAGRFCLASPGDLVLVVSESTSFEPGPIRLWNFETGQLVHEFGGFEVKPDSLAVSPDGRRFAAAFSQGDDRGKEFRAIVLLWDLERPGEPPARCRWEKASSSPASRPSRPTGGSS